MREAEFIPTLEESEELRQGYCVYELGPSSYFDRRYRLELLLTLPGTLRIRDKDDRLVREVKTYRNYIVRVTKSYNAAKQQISIDAELCPNSVESLNPVSPLSRPLLKRMITPLELMDKGLEFPHPRDVYFSVRAIIDKYLEVEAEAVTLLSVYVVASYFFRLFNTFPYLYVFGPRQSGKTKLLTLMAKLCYNAVPTVNLSASALFRVVNDFGATLVIDESEYLRDMEKRSEIQTLLLAGYKRDVANVMRVEGEEKKQVKIYNVYGPKVMASINYPHDVLLDRCIVINMVRGSSSKVNLEPAETFQDARDQLYLMLLSRFDEVYLMRDLDDFSNPLLVARERELWRPLLVVATWLSQYLSEEEKGQLWADLEAMIRLNVEKKTEMRLDSELSVLLAALAGLVEDDGYYSVAVIRSAILDRYRLDENELKQAQKVWTAEKVGRMLTGLKFAKRKRGDGTFYYITAEGVRKLCESYGVDMESEENLPGGGTLASYGPGE